MTTVLLSRAMPRDALEALEGRARVRVLRESTEAALGEAIADVDALILGTNVRVTREVLARAQRLRIISRTGVGVDNVDVAAASERGILVCNTPGINTVSVCEHTIGLMLALAKQIPLMDREVRRGNWRVRNEDRAVELQGKTLGLVGVGAIGASVARACRWAFGMHVVAYDPFVEKMEGVEMTPSVEEVFRRADVLSIHVPYTSETHHMVNERLLGLMKPSAFLINTARGAVVDERALVEALKSGRIAGAGLDVFTEEPPPPGHPLLEMSNVVLSPHSAALTKETRLRAAKAAVEAVVDFVEGRRPKHIFNAKQLDGNQQAG